VVSPQHSVCSQSASSELYFPALLSPLSHTLFLMLYHRNLLYLHNQHYASDKCTHTHTHTHKYMHAYPHKYSHTHRFTQIHTHAHKYIHTHTHTHRVLSNRLSPPKSDADEQKG